MDHYDYHIEFGDDADYVVYVAWTEHGPYELAQWMIPGTELED
jgi:hypothetical protein